MPQVLRIAHPDVLMPIGVPAGPYLAKSYLDDWDSDLYDDLLEVSDTLNFENASQSENLDHEPPPCRDGLGNIYDYEVCGFTDLDALFSWFRVGMDKMRAAGFLLHVYDVDEDYMRKGNKQVVFDPSGATLVDTMDL